MKQSFRRVLACVLAIAMLAGLGVTAFAAEAEGAQNAELFEDISAYREQDNFTYPTKEGKVFGGWYTDAALTKTLSKATLTGPAYAKWVDENVLSVKWQITADTAAESEKTNLRLLTTVDSLEYDKVGFHSDMYGKVEGGMDFASTKVYKRIKSSENGEIVAHDPTVFSPESTHFAAHTLSNIKNSYFDLTMTVTPWWVTRDGTRVYGIPKEIRISDDWAQAQTLTRADLQEAFLATMWAYYWKQEQVQYDSYLYTSVDYMDGGVFRNTSEVAPEYGTADTTIYSVCSSYPYMAYCNTFEKDGAPFRWMTGSKPYATDYITYTMWETGAAETTVLRWAQKMTSEDQAWCDQYGWDQQESFTAYRDMDASELAAWFAENWQSVLQPGDILVTFRPTGHAVTYIGNGMLLESAGSKWSSGHEAYEDDGSINVYTVEDFFVNGSCCLGNNKIDRTTGTNSDGTPIYATTYFLIMRPINLLVDAQDQALAGVSVNASTRSRQQYEGLEIDRTVDITPFGTAVTGDTLTYSVKLTNNSGSAFQGMNSPGDTGNTPVNYLKWHDAHFGTSGYSGMRYEALPVTETIPAGTELVEGSITGNGTFENGTIRWSVDLDAGSDVTLSYQVRVTEGRGGEITNDGGMVADIPSNSITNRVGGAKLDAADRISAFEADIARYASQYGFLKETGTEFASAFYEKVLGLRLELPTTQELFDALFEPATAANSHPDAAAAGLFVPRSAPSAGLEAYGNMMVRNYLGGEMIHTPHLELRRINEFRTEYLEPGDILVKGDLSGSTVIAAQTLVYLGDGQFAYYAGSRVAASGSTLRIWDSFGYDFFFTLRPSQVYDDLGAELPAAEVFTPVHSGEGGGEAQETAAERQAALVEVADAYLAKGELLQYDSEVLIGAQKNTTLRSASFRQTEQMSPEDITSDSSYYGVIGAMIWEVYHEALGLEVGDCPGALVSAGRSVFQDWFVYNSANETDTLHAEDLDRFIAEVLQPGDILFYTVGSSNKLHLYLGDGKIMLSSGKKYTVKTGTEVHEDTPGFYTTDFKTAAGTNLKSIAVVRPIADPELAEQTLITPATASRLAYPGLVIDRTVDVSPYGTAYPGQILTYTIAVTNTGSQDYSALPVREQIPANTSYSGSDTGAFADGSVTWTLDVPAGQTVTLRYQAEVTGSCGQSVVADGGYVADIPSNSLVTAIGAEAPGAEALERLASVTAESGAELGLAELGAQDIIRRVYGWAITGRTDAMLAQAAWDADAMYAMMSAQKNSVVSGGTVYDFPTRAQAESAAPGTGELYDQIVCGYIGGYRLYTRQIDNARIQEFSLRQLQPGDVLVKLVGGDSARAHYILYLGDGRFLHTDTASGAGTFEILTWENSESGTVWNNCVWDSLAKYYDFFFLQRPGQSVMLSGAAE